jgi:hypothetical protein
MKTFQLLSIFALGAFTAVSGFTSPVTKMSLHSQSSLQISRETQQPSVTAVDTMGHKQLAIRTAAVLTSMAAPLITLAENAPDDYEYGAVNAPGGLTIAWVGGILAILSALLPVVLKGGEEEFEKMKERDDFGNANDALKKRRK